MSHLVNFYCINDKYDLATEKDTVQNCLFIIADTKEHRIYCYTGRELETMHSAQAFSVEGIVFHACYANKIARWENLFDDTILAQVKFKNNGMDKYQTFSFCVSDYTVARLVPAFNIGFKKSCFKISGLAGALSLNAKTSIYPVLTLDSTLRTITDTVKLREQVAQYKGISHLDCMGFQDERVDFENLHIIGMSNLCGAFSQAPNLKEIRMGCLDLSCLDSVYRMLYNSPQVQMVDFSQTVGDLDKRVDWRKETTINRFEITELGGKFFNFIAPLVIYLNKDSVLFNSLLVKANPKFTMLNGVVPRSDMVEQTKRIIGKQVLMGKVDKDNQRFFVRVDKLA